MSQEFKKQYPQSMVVIQNRVEDCFRGMTLDEKRLFILATSMVRTKNISSTNPLFVSSQYFAEECNIDISTAYSALEQATEKIFDRFFSYVKEDGSRVKIRWVSKVEYKAGRGGAKLYFTEDVLESLRTFDGDHPFTKYKKEIGLKLQREYSLNLYHIFKRYEKIGSEYIELPDLFEKLNLPISYTRIGNLKDRVIKPSLEEINLYTDLEVSCVNKKMGRSVVGLKFIIKQKTKATKKNVNDFPKLTQSQVHKYSKVLSYLPELSSLSTFSSYDAFSSWIAGILVNPKSVSESTAKKICCALINFTDFKESR